MSTFSSLGYQNHYPIQLAPNLATGVTIRLDHDGLFFLPYKDANTATTFGYDTTSSQYEVVIQAGRTRLQNANGATIL